jgi:hypothetical protein
MKTYYVLVDVEDTRLGAYVSAENIAAAFDTAAAKYKMRHPRLHVEAIAAQEIADGSVDPAIALLLEQLCLQDQ